MSNANCGMQVLRKSPGDATDDPVLAKRGFNEYPQRRYKE